MCLCCDFVFCVCVLCLWFSYVVCVLVFTLRLQYVPCVCAFIFWCVSPLCTFNWCHYVSLEVFVCFLDLVFTSALFHFFFPTVLVKIFASLVCACTFRLLFVSVVRGCCFQLLLTAWPHFCTIRLCLHHVRSVSRLKITQIRDKTAIWTLNNFL